MSTPVPFWPMTIGIDDAAGPSRAALALLDADGKVIAECEPNAVTRLLVAEVGRLRRRVDELEREHHAPEVKR